MPAVLRFPNPGSNFGHLLEFYRAIFDGVEQDLNAEFGLDEMKRIVVAAGLASSSGAVGDEAIRRSTRTDRSRDALYNQIKMYSEVYRMLGVLRPGSQKLLAHTTILGQYVASQQITPPSNLLKRLIQEQLLSIVFPNPNTMNIGIVNLRPFPMILRAAAGSGGYIHRDEIIVCIMSCLDDTIGDSTLNAIEKIAKMRASGRQSNLTVEEFASSLGIQSNSLKNYTRFPLGVLKSPLTGWADVELFSRSESPYGKASNFYRLSEYGMRTSVELEHRPDIRHHMIGKSSLNERGAFTLLTSWRMLERCGVEMDSDAIRDIDAATQNCSRLLNNLDIGDATETLYSPFQQASDQEIESALSLSESVRIS